MERIFLGYFRLLEAAEMGDLEDVKERLAAGDDINYADRLVISSSLSKSTLHINNKLDSAVQLSDKTYNSLYNVIRLKILIHFRLQHN